MHGIMHVRFDSFFVIRPSYLIRAELLLILALILDNNGVIFPIVWILLFIDGMNAAAIFPISMRMIHLRLACF